MRLALFEPDIPQNTGTLLRLAACFGVAVDLIEPLRLCLRRPPAAPRPARLCRTGRRSAATHSWDAFLPARDPAVAPRAADDARRRCRFTAFPSPASDTLLLGRESAGVPDLVHEAAAARVVIPLRPGDRSLNVAVAGAIALGEALRQTGLSAGAVIWPRMTASS